MLANIALRAAGGSKSRNQKSGSAPSALTAMNVPAKTAEFPQQLPHTIDTMVSASFIENIKTSKKTKKTEKAYTFSMATPMLLKKTGTNSSFL